LTEWLRSFSAKRRDRVVTHPATPSTTSPQRNDDMASEIVATPQNPAIQAFAGYDASVFISWLGSIGDVMLNKGEPPAETAADLGGLILALSEAARELQEREMQKARATP